MVCPTVFPCPRSPRSIQEKTSDHNSRLCHAGLPLDDAAAAWREIAADWRLQATTAASIASIAAFNFAGINVSVPAVTNAGREASSSLRLLCDQCLQCVA